MRLRALALTPFGRANLARSDAVQRLLAFAALIVIVVVFSLLSPNFLQFDNLVGILLATTVTGVLALGVTFVIITGGIDLSIGTVMTRSAGVTGPVGTVWQPPLPPPGRARRGTGSAAGDGNSMPHTGAEKPSSLC